MSITTTDRCQYVAVRLLVLAFAAQPVAAEAEVATAEPARSTETLEVRYWPNDPDDPYYPERHDPRFEYLWQRPSFGIAFSGGGTRSASAVWGQLRGLARLGWLDRARYISSVSGGAWAAVPYAFLANACEAETRSAGKRSFTCLDSDDQTVLDRWFLGEYCEPDELDDGELAEESGSFVYALSRTQLIKLYLSRLPIRGDETYARALGKRFLHAVGQYDCQPVVGGCPDPPKHHYFVAHQEQGRRIAASSNSLNPSAFVPMAPGRPFLIAGATIIAKKRFAGRPVDLFPFEMTPLYVGFPSRLTSRFGDSFGGGFIEPPGWDGEDYEFRPEEVPGERFQLVRVTKNQPLKRGIRLRYRMTLADVLGGSGAAPALRVRRLGLSYLGFPEWDAPALGVSVNAAPEYAFGDGGHLENLGVIPLLGRQVENILVFVNSRHPFRFATEDPDPPADRKSSCEKAKDLTDLHELFSDCWLPGLRHDSTEKPQPLLTAANGEDVAGTWPGPAIEQIEAAFKRAQRADEPLVHCGRYHALDNPRFAIRAYSPRICWVVLDRTGEWVKGVPRSSRLGRQLHRRGLPFWATYSGFPHYGTLFHRWFKLRVIDLSEQQVNALAHLTAWTVVEAANTVGPYLGLDRPSPLAGSPPRSHRCGDERRGPRVAPAP